MVPLADVPNAVTLYSAMVNISRVVGPALAGVLIVTVGYGWCFTLDAVSYTTVLVALALMRPDELRRVARTPRGRGQIRAGVRYIASVRELWVTFVMLLIVGMLGYNFNVVFPLLVEKALGGSDGAYTLVYSAFSAGALIGAVIVARRTTITVRTVAIGAVWLGVSMLVLSAVPNVPFAVLVAAVTGGGSIAYMTASTALAQLRTDQPMIGRVLAIQTVLLVGTTPVGGPILGWLSDVAGGRAPVLIGGISALVAAAFGLVAGKETRRSSEDEDEPGWVSIQEEAS
jgi:MFS family permease